MASYFMSCNVTGKIMGGKVQIYWTKEYWNPDNGYVFRQYLISCIYRLYIKLLEKGFVLCVAPKVPQCAFWEFFWKAVFYLM